ncbi:hypothetical protein HMPREF1705_04009 [Acetomicrobium hydrogeniformans ATCC BAA-1850]|jgi:hypothetical protein|uniref:Uncharacterized protein n=1 Tax=Acetomicrobium hydrogeniformans ATCC BAA-1850 TaxID=592015 RepID=A0A0T5X8R8_9BACT|nr:hypothetical protein HMPREF1705_04009 [Acetomicrobium hydrogeniformans ATCC BAA-1850]
MSLQEEYAKLLHSHGCLLRNLRSCGAIIEPLYIALSRSREPKNILLIHKHLRTDLQHLLEVLHAPINQLKSSAQEIQLWFNTQQEGVTQ